MRLDCKRAVFIGAHTDDEMICAGTLHKLVRQGTEVAVLTAAPAAIQSDRQGSVESARVVEEEWHVAMNAIGVSYDDRHFYCATPSVDLFPYKQRICQWVFDFVEGWKPDLALVLSPEDENPAHAIVGTESERVMRGRVATTVRCLFPWNHGSSRPNLFVELSEEDLEVKRRVIAAYQSQMFRYAYPEMLMGYVRGDGLAVKVAAAERFEIVRCVA